MMLYPGAGYCGEYFPLLGQLPQMARICVMGNYRPIVSVTGTYRPVVMVTGTYHPTIFVTGNWSNC
jgi:hypothetical protein